MNRQTIKFYLLAPVVLPIFILGAIGLDILCLPRQWQIKKVRCKVKSLK